MESSCSKLVLNGSGEDTNGCPIRHVRRGWYTNHVSSVRNVPEKDTGGLEWTRKALEERKNNAVVCKEDTDVLILLNSYTHELWYGGLLYVLYVYMINL